jgi:hypothetical protein
VPTPNPDVMKARTAQQVAAATAEAPIREAEADTEPRPEEAVAANWHCYFGNDL